MKNKLLKTILVLSIAILASCNANKTSYNVVLPSINNASNEPQPSEDISTLPPSYGDSPLNSGFGGYYSGLNLNTTGTALLSELRSLNSSKRKFTPGYKNLGSYFLQTDGDPDKPGNIIAFYSGTSVSFNGSFSGSVNREHVWPNSHGGNYVEGDLHMTRPTITSENGSRGNSFYVEGMKHSANGWDPAMESFGLEKYRGISARIIFYCVVASNNLKLVEAEKGSSGDNSMGKLSDLLKWNLEYDIDDTEIRRNEATQGIQGNRNPFIDDRSLACRVWGNYNENTKKICSSTPSTNDPVPPTSISLNPSNSSIKVGNTQQLSVSATPYNAIKTVTWSSSNTNVATVNNGIVTGVSEGTATITATSTEDPSITATCTIIVTNPDYAGTGEYEYTFTSAVFGTKPNNETKNLENVEWSMTHDGNYAGYDGVKGAQFGSGNNPAKTLELSTVDIPGTINEITINASGASSTNAKLTITVGGVQYGNTIDLTTTATNYTFTGSSSGKIVIKMTQTSSKALYIKSINIKYTE